MGIAQGAISTPCWNESADDLTPLPHTEGIRKKLLQDSLEFYQATVRESATDEAGRELLGSGYARIGDIQRLLGDAKTAEDAYLKSIEICKLLVADFPGNSEYAATLAGAYNNLANLQKSQGRGGDAEVCYRDALTLLLPFLHEGSADLEKQTWPRLQQPRQSSRRGRTSWPRPRNEPQARLRSNCGKKLLWKIA